MREAGVPQLIGFWAETAPKWIVKKKVRNTPGHVAVLPHVKGGEVY